MNTVCCSITVSFVWHIISGPVPVISGITFAVIQVSYQGMQSGLPVFVVDEFRDLEIFMQNDFLQSLTFYISPTGNVKNRSYLDRI